MSIETPSQSNRAADRLKQFDANAQEQKYWDTQIGDAGLTDFSPEARARLEDVAVYDAHLEKIASDETYGTFDASLDSAENGTYKDSVDRTIEADPKLRRLVLMADIYNNLSNQPHNVAIDDAEKRVDQKEQDLLEALITFEETSSLHKDDITEIIDRISNRMYAEAPVATTDTPAAKKDTAPFIDTEDLKAEQLSDEDKATIADMEAPDISLTDDNAGEVKAEQLSDEDKATIADMEAPDISLTDDAKATKDKGSFLGMDELYAIAEKEAADASPEADNQEAKNSGSFLDLEAIQKEEEDKLNAENHRRNRFNPFYRAQMAFNDFRSKIKERGSRSDDERNKASKRAIGAAAVGVLALTAVAVASRNPDLIQDAKDWLGDFWSNPGFDNNDTPQNGDVTDPEQTPDDTNDALDPRDDSDLTPAAPELLNAPAFNTPNGGGGEMLMTNLGVDTQKWYSISADLPERFSNEFYRVFEPSGHVDIRFSHPGYLSEEAQKVILQRLGK